MILKSLFRASTGAIVLMAFVVFMGCRKDPNTMGLNYVDTNLNFGTLENTPIVTYTVPFDSVRSNNPSTGIALVGGYNDPAMGRHDAWFVNQLLPGGTSPDFGNTAVCDSAFLYIPYTITPSAWYGDTTVPFRITVEILEEFLEKEKAYYSNTGFATGDLVADYTFTPTPTTLQDYAYLNNPRPMLRIPIDTAFIAEVIFPLALSGAMNSDDAFTQAFNGLAIRGDNSNEAIIGLLLSSAETRLRLHFHNDTDTADYDLRTTTNAVLVNLFEHDYTMAEFDLQNQNTVLGEANMYSQAMSGVVGIVEIPFLPSYQDSGWLLNHAELILPVEEDSEIGYRLPASVQLVIDDTAGRRVISDYITEGSGAVGGAVVTGELEDKYYRFVLTRQMQRFLDNKDEIARFIIVPELNSSDQARVIFNGNLSGAEPSKLNLYYTETK